MSESITIQEQLVPGFQVNRETRTITDVCLLGPESKNGWKYSTQVIAEAAPAYNRKPVYLNHAPTSGNRDVRDVAGRIANPRLKDGRLYGDIKAIGKNGDMLLDLAESDVDGIGMSHLTDNTSVVRGKTVIKIGKIKSVDLVDGPATTRTLRESALELQEQLKPILTGKKSATDRLKEIYEACGESFVLEEQELPETPKLTLETVDDLRGLAAEKPAIKTLIEQFDKLQKNAWVAEVLAEHKLPESAKPALLRCENKELMLENGKVLRETIDALKPAPTQKGREPAKTGGPSMDEIVGAIKG